MEPSTTTYSSSVMSKEKIFELMDYLGSELARLLMRWGIWLIVVLSVAIARSCYEYIVKDNRVDVIRILALFVMTVSAGVVAIFVVSVTDLPVPVEAVIVIVATLISFVLIDAAVSINVKTIRHLFITRFWAAIDAIRDYGRAGNGSNSSKNKSDD